MNPVQKAFKKLKKKEKSFKAQKKWVDTVHMWYKWKKENNRFRDLDEQWENVMYAIEQVTRLGDKREKYENLKNKLLYDNHLTG